MDKNDIERKLNNFKNNFSFVTTDGFELDSLVTRAINETLSKCSFDDPNFYKNAKDLLKKYIRCLINKKYTENRDFLFSRTVSLLLLSKEIDIFKKTQIFAAFFKAIDDVLDDEFLKKVLDDNPKIANYFSSIVVTDGCNIFVDSMYKDDALKFSPIINLYIENIAPSQLFFIKKIQSADLLTREELYKFLKMAKNGDMDAVSTIIEKNLSLVKKIASSYCGINNIEFDDLYQVGTIGLMEAIKLYDASRGYAFSTYAVYWIKKFIRNYIIENKRTIKIPKLMQEKMYKIEKLVEKFEQEEGHSLSVYEISEKVGVSFELLESYYANMHPVESINKSVSKDPESEELVFILRDEKDSYQELFDQMFMDDFLNTLRKKFDAKKFDIFCRRNALLGYDRKQTLLEIATFYGVTHQSIGQLEINMYKKIMNDSTLRSFFTLGNSIEPKKTNTRKTVPSKESSKMRTISFTTYCKETYGIEDVDMLLPKLSKTDIECLKRRFGDNLSTVKNVSENVIVDANFIMLYKIPNISNLQSVSIEKKQCENEHESSLIVPSSVDSTSEVIDSHCNGKVRKKVLS